jgi:hypothetical protein
MFIPDYLAQSTGQVTAVTLLTAILTLFVALTIVGTLRHPSGPGAINLLAMAAFVYVGWTAARWPGVDYDQGMVLGIWHMLLDSLRTVWDVFWNISGLDSVADRLGMNR